MLRHILLRLSLYLPGGVFLSLNLDIFDPGEKI